MLPTRSTRTARPDRPRRTRSTATSPSSAAARSDTSVSGPAESTWRPLRGRPGEHRRHVHLTGLDAADQGVRVVLDLDDARGATLGGQPLRIQLGQHLGGLVGGGADGQGLRGRAGARRRGHLGTLAAATGQRHHGCEHQDQQRFHSVHCATRGSAMQYALPGVRVAIRSHMPCWSSLSRSGLDELDQPQVSTRSTD